MAVWIQFIGENKQFPNQEDVLRALAAIEVSATLFPKLDDSTMPAWELAPQQGKGHMAYWTPNAQRKYDGLRVSWWNDFVSVNGPMHPFSSVYGFAAMNADDRRLWIHLFGEILRVFGADRLFIFSEHFCEPYGDDLDTFADFREWIAGEPEALSLDVIAAGSFISEPL